MLEELHEECGVIGIYNGDNVVRNVTMGLYALQHRGQESAGFAVTDGEKVRVRKSMGLVSTLLREHNVDELQGFAGIGHVRYSTTGASTLANAQPILVSCKWGQLAVAHNGNITNANELRAEMEADGHIFQTTGVSAWYSSVRTRCTSPATGSGSARFPWRVWGRPGALPAKPARSTCLERTMCAIFSRENS